MEVPSARISVVKINPVLNFLREINASSLKTTIAIVFLSIVLSGLALGFFTVQQNTTADRLFKESKSSYTNKGLAEVKKSQDNQVKKQQASDNQRKNDLTNLKSQIEKFYRDKGYYPPSLFNMTPDYLSQVPKDPESQIEYFYQVGLDQKSFILRTTLSNGKEYELTN